MRDIISRIGGIDRCVTEFVRISDRVLPRRVYLRLCPELLQLGTTRSSTPVFVQLLGSEPQLLADTAAKLADLGAPGIDLNFGCPAKTVNRNRGGAILLKEPDLVGRIVEQVRAQLPDGIPLTAKMRLGYDDTSVALHNAVAIAQAGADELCVHARTKVEGYRPPAHWHWLERIRTAVTIPVVANGEIWSLKDFDRCLSVSGCQRVMLGRGLVSRPDLALQIRQHLEGRVVKEMSWSALVPWIEDYYSQLHLITPRYADGRLKQWLGLLRRNYSQAGRLLQQLRRESGEQTMRQGLAQSTEWTVENGTAA